MLNKIVVVIFVSLFCHAFALNSHNSPVLMFKNKENVKTYESGVLSATTQVKQREFEQRLQSLDGKILFFVADDLSPEDLALKDEKHVKAFQNVASGVDMVDYMLFVENAVSNKMTQGQDVAHTEVSITNELTEEPSSDKNIIIAKLPGYHVSESKFHWLQRIDRALYAVSQLPQYKDYLFVLTSEKNSRLQQQQQEHSRKRRAAVPQQTHQYGDKNFLIYVEDFLRDLKDEKLNDTSIPIESFTSEKKSENITIVTINSEKYKLVMNFVYDSNDEYWTLNTSESTIANQSMEGRIFTEIGAPANFSYSCSSEVYFTVNETDINGVYFKGFQIQINFTNSDGIIMKRFDDSYDCIGFTSTGIWSGLFITFILILIISIAISSLMNIRTMDRFDDPKGKTITVAASE